MTNLKLWLSRNEHISHRLHCDNLVIVNKLHLLMKGRRNDPSFVDLRSAQKQVKGCRNPQNLEQSDKSGRTYQQLNLQSAHDLILSAIISSNCLSGGTEIKGCVAKGNGSGQMTDVQGRAIVQNDRWDSET